MSADELRQPLIRYLTRLGLDSADAHDVAQESFLRLEQHRPEGNIRGWLFRVAHNEARNRQRSYERRHSMPLDGLDLPDGADPEAALMRKQKFERLEAALKTLAPAERECVLLRAQGLRYREIGEAIGLPTSMVADMVDRAVRILAGKCCD
jgi:RNA polymerase sigma-70 factor, ECF subfamily